MKLLLTAGVTTVAEAAFQDRLWRPGLEPLADLADIRIVHCIVDRKVAAASIHQRHPGNLLRRAHSDPQSKTPVPSAQTFDRVSIGAA
jgi:predicted kinase